MFLNISDKKVLIVLLSVIGKSDLLIY